MDSVYVWITKQSDSGKSFIVFSKASNPELAIEKVVQRFRSLNTDPATIATMERNLRSTAPHEMDFSGEVGFVGIAPLQTQ